MMPFDPARRWSYLEPGLTIDGYVVNLSEEEILDEYYAYWSGRMLAIGKSPLITIESCIEDWVVVHWAW